MQPHEFWTRLADHLDTGKPAFLVVVAYSDGSSPGTAGAKMFVTRTGSQVGTVGGGIMEFNLVDEARDALIAGGVRPQCRTLWHQKEAPGETSGMICAGNQTHISLIVAPGDAGTVRRAAEASKAGAPIHLLYSPNGLTIDETENPRAVGPMEFTRTGEDWQLVESMANHRRIAIIGGGHCGCALTEVMHRLGYHITLVDRRPDVKTFAQDRCASEKVAVTDYANAGACVDWPEQTAVIVMTTDYTSDVRALAGVLRLPFPFIGVMGSVAKINHILADLRLEGFGDKVLERIHAPVGIQIGSHTPEEIAVSVAAQIIQEHEDRS
jgi:xanthine dehydrogenase accessory factor